MRSILDRTLVWKFPEGDWGSTDGTKIDSWVAGVGGTDWPSDELQATWIKEYEAHLVATAYVEDRIAAYAEISEQLDLLYHDMAADKGDKSGEWFKAVKKVKDDNAKPD